MLYEVLGWLLILFALASGVSKLFGVKMEKDGAQKYGINYSVIRYIGIAQLLSIPFVFFHYNWVGIILIGTPCIWLVFIGIKHQDHSLSLFSAAIIGAIVTRWVLQ